MDGRDEVVGISSNYFMNDIASILTIRRAGRVQGGVSITFGETI
jgi:hypothetical protein